MYQVVSSHKTKNRSLSSVYTHYITALQFARLHMPQHRFKRYWNSKGQVTWNGLKNTNRKKNKNFTMIKFVEFIVITRHKIPAIVKWNKIDKDCLSEQRTKIGVLVLSRVLLWQSDKPISACMLEHAEMTCTSSICFWLLFRMLTLIVSLPDNAFSSMINHFYLALYIGNHLKQTSNSIRYVSIPQNYWESHFGCHCKLFVLINS